MSAINSKSEKTDEDLINVYFDGGCPLCRREIDFYQAIQPPHTFRWNDISSEVLQTETWGFDKKSAMENLHVRDCHGNLHTGVDAFACIWEKFPKFRWLSHLIKKPILYQLAKVGYLIFAKIRLTWRR